MKTPDEQDPKSALAPVDIVHTPVAHAYQHIHSILVLAIFYASFSNIVADPISALLLLAPVTASLQLLYCIICLPTTVARSSQPQRRRPGSSHGVGKAQGLPFTTRIIVRTSSCTTSTVATLSTTTT